MSVRVHATAWIGVLALSSQASWAGPWASPGDELLRHDIQMLADAGILRGPVTAWPLSWPDIARDIADADDAQLGSGVRASLIRVQRRAHIEDTVGFSGLGTRVAGAHDPREFRGFSDSPREEGELTLRTGWLSDHIAVNLQGAVVADADDQRQFRPDGSYIGLNVGNVAISAGYLERWWGPGWDGSLILSTNARPIPSFSIERNYSDPFETPLLSWIGHWRASLSLGELEEHDVPVSKVRLLAARVTIRPRTWLELGFSRTAQWCGSGRPCGWQTFRDLLVGRDNQVEDGSLETQPGNQMAGYDLRLRSPWSALPAAVYTQWIGEDEAGGLPSKFMGLFGLEAWWNSSFGTVRARLEYADTTCAFVRQSPEFNCSYRHALYPQGYTYRDRVIGHSIDNDSRMASFGILVAGSDGSTLSLEARLAELNRDGAGEHSISQVSRDINDVELRYSRTLGAGRVTAAVGYNDRALPVDEGGKVRGFVTWQQGF